uniref:Mating pheromone receptor a2 n=2 Tax=Rhodosporidiobolus colostri TaxID=255053 RepID=G8H2L5_9BASI|nr:mating pheromone receptor a2 [Rhodosporidiobolus colostri]
MPSQLPYIICSGLLIVLNSGPLYWQVRQGNSAPIAMGFWVVLLNAIEFIQALVWYSDAKNRAPVWCDIAIGVGGSIGRLAAVYCIARFLADVVSPRATALTRQDRRRRAIHDYFMSFGVPIIIMACHVVYQANRFAIIRGVGCQATQYMSWPTLIMRLVWGPVFAVGGMMYSAYTVFRLIRHRRNFHRVVAGAHSALTTTRFIRLAALSISYLAIGVPLAIYGAVNAIDLSGPYLDYSWSYFRSGWHDHPITIVDTPAVADLSTWSNVIVGVIFFAAFGFGTEATEVYRRAARACFGGRGSQSSGSKAFRSCFRRSGQRSERPQDSQAIRVFTRDVRLPSPAYPVGVKVVVEKQEDFV